MKIMVRIEKWLQNAFCDHWRFWEDNSSQNELLNIVIGPSLQEENAHWLLSTNLDGILNFTANFLLEEFNWRCSGPEFSPTKRTLLSWGIKTGLVLHQQHRK
jgi:hypothetical protein